MVSFLLPIDALVEVVMSERDHVGGCGDGLFCALHFLLRMLFLCMPTSPVIMHAFYLGVEKSFSLSSPPSTTPDERSPEVPPRIGGGLLGPGGSPVPAVFWLRHCHPASRNSSSAAPNTIITIDLLRSHDLIHVALTTVITIDDDLRRHRPSSSPYTVWCDRPFKFRHIQIRSASCKPLNDEFYARFAVKTEDLRLVPFLQLLGFIPLFSLGKLGFTSMCSDSQHCHAQLCLQIL
ncbi:hypothetical protein R6Q57_028558 [Mikania cordata]